MVDNISSLSFPLSPPPPPHPPPPPQKTNLPMLYYGLAVVGTAAILLAVYNLIIIKRCTQRRGRSGQRQDGFLEITSSRSLEYSYGNLLSSFKYEKDNMGVGVRGSDYECAVCLSVFEDGEEVKQLPRCRHSFHAPCIDMWLYSHSDCPLCRSRVDPPLPLCHSRRQTAVTDAQHNSREELVDHSAISNSNSTVSV